MPEPITWYALGRDVNDTETIEEAIDAGILAHNLDPSAHGQENESVYEHRAAELLDHVNYSIYNIKTNPAARVYKAIVSTGVEGDFTTLQAAIDWANLYGGGTVFIKAGIYVLNADLVLYSNIKLLGEDQDLTILDFQGGEYTIYAQGTSGTHKRNIELQDLQITNCGLQEGQALKLIYCDDCTIYRVKITDTYYASDRIGFAIYLSHCVRVEIKNCYLLDNDAGIHLHDCSHIDVEFNYIYNTYADTLYFIASPNTIFRHNLLETNGRVGAESYIYFGSNCDNSVIDSNFFLTGRTTCIWNEVGSKIVITNNVFTVADATDYALNLNDNDRMIIANNRIYGFDDSGIYLVASNVRCVISNNVVTNCGGYGIEIVAASNADLAVIGNVLYNNASGGVVDGGTGDEVAHNVT